MPVTLLTRVKTVPHSPQPAGATRVEAATWSDPLPMFIVLLPVFSRLWLSQISIIFSTLTWWHLALTLPRSSYGGSGRLVSRLANWSCEADVLKEAGNPVKAYESISYHTNYMWKAVSCSSCQHAILLICWDTRWDFLWLQCSVSVQMIAFLARGAGAL